MKIDKYIVVSATPSRWGSSFLPKLKMVERKPTLEGNEVALRLNIELPDALFKRPTLEATFKIDERMAPKVEITQEVVSNIENLIKENIGMNIHVQLVEHEEPLEEEQE